jgi:MoxR-like ATPase
VTDWPYFAPSFVEEAPPPDDPLVPRDRDVYVFTPDQRIVLAVNVAMSTRRPLLIYGPPGSGKSSLAPNVARILHWRYYEEVISSRTEAQDLLWTFDAVRRLRDAQASHDLKPDSDYTEPGVFWWAFDRQSALEQGGSEQAQDPGTDLEAPAVVLLDEIDKADPDLPNNLLMPLGSYRFAHADSWIKAPEDSAPLIVITTNDERDLSRPFLRRCVVLTLEHPTAAEMVSIAEAHLGSDEAYDDLYTTVAELVESMRPEAKRQRMPVPSTAEYLDTLRACIRLNLSPTDPRWEQMVRITLDKRNATESLA